MNGYIQYHPQGEVLEIPDVAGLRIDEDVAVFFKPGPETVAAVKLTDAVTVYVGDTYLQAH